MILRPTLADEREQEEGATYHGIVRYTHVHCGYTTRKRGEMEILNDLDPACPGCLATYGEEGPDYAYGVMVWENADGTIVETESNGRELVRWSRVFTHCTIYKSWTNDPDNGEWWIRPEPNTGDLDDDHTVGFEHYWQARAALGNVAQIITEISPLGPDGVVWRDRHNPIYQPGRF